MDVGIRCRCGTLRGTARDVSPKQGSHVYCYCDDCQAFAHFLSRSDTLDAHGGTDIFQMSPGKVSFTAGVERLACMRLTPRGLLRWYATCCNTPIGNTLPTGKVPFVGLVTVCFDMPGGQPLDTALGPVLVRAFRRFAQPASDPIPPDRVAMARVVLHFTRLLLVWKLRGDTARSAFFDAGRRQPIVAPRILEESERAHLRQVVAAGVPAQSAS